MIMGFIFLVLACLTYTTDLFHHSLVFTVIFAIISALSFVRSYKSIKIYKRFRLTARRTDYGVMFYLKDRKFNRVHELEVLESHEIGSSLLPVYDSLNRITYRAHRSECDFNKLLIAFTTMSEDDRTLASDNLFNLMLLIKQSRPIIENTKYEDYTISYSARKYFQTALRRAI